MIRFRGKSKVSQSSIKLLLMSKNAKFYRWEMPSISTILLFEMFNIYKLMLNCSELIPICSI